MLIYKTYILLLTIQILSRFAVSKERNKIPEKSGMHDRLEHEIRNRECCARNMRCCTKEAQPPRIQIRAVLARCPNNPSNLNGAEEGVLTRYVKTPVEQSRQGIITRFPGFERDEPLAFSQIRNCHMKLVLTTKLMNAGITYNRTQYVVVDHVFERKTGKMTKLLYPYVVKIRQKPLVQVYALRYSVLVNAEATEEVISKAKPHFKGCDMGNKNPTCGQVVYKGKVVPYSQGFCCSCDPAKNYARQPITECASGPLIVYSDPTYLLDGIECPRNMKGSEDEHPKRAEETVRETGSVAENFVQKGTHFKRESGKLVPVKLHPKRHKGSSNISSKRTYSTESGIPQIFPSDRGIEDVVFGALDPLDGRNGRGDLEGKLENLEHLLSEMKQREERKKRQANIYKQPIREDANCSDHYTPHHVDPNTYHESAHCLRFSDLWYKVYELGEPTLEHSLIIQVFVRIENFQGKPEWYDLTKGKALEVGTRKPKNRFDDAVAAEYTSHDDTKPDPKFISLNYKKVFLLVPEKVTAHDKLKHPEVANGPGEYLVVHQSQVRPRGDLCNVIGVGFEAFYNQPCRCSVQRNTCLANQPAHLWKHDHQAELSNKRGCFFLKNYGPLPQDPIVKRGDVLYLTMGYLGSHSSTIELEINAYMNCAVSRKSLAAITEVYIEATNPTTITITAKVTNAAISSSLFYVKMADCPVDLPKPMEEVRSRSVLIPPQKQYEFELELHYEPQVGKFYCSIQVLNGKDELVALRRIRIQKHDRCICAWHCLCACMSSSSGLTCKPMSLAHYHAAGFPGSLPVDNFAMEYDLMDEVLFLLVLLLCVLVALLLVMGCTKGLVGLICIPEIGQWGWDSITKPKPIRKYYESELACRQVVYDSEGWPIHPDTKIRARFMSPGREFFMNIFFFFVYPMATMCCLVKKVWCVLKSRKSESKRASDYFISPTPSELCYGEYRRKTSSSGSSES